MQTSISCHKPFPFHSSCFLCTHFLIIAIFHHNSLSLYIKALISLVFFEEAGNCSAYMCVHEKRISHNIDLYASLLSSHSRKRRRMFDVQGIFHSFAIASPSNATPKKKETKNCIFFHVAHFSAAFILFFSHSKRNWWFYCLKCIAKSYMTHFSGIFLMTVFYHMHGATAWLFSNIQKSL